MASKERLILVDGSSLIYRAYYAIPGNLATSQGLHTNAIYGFVTMFKKVMAGRSPAYGAVVFDAPGKSFRAEKYSQYKAHRPRMDAELKEQLPYIDKVVEAHRFPLLRLPGYEADDIIATLTERAMARDMEVHIISADKDFAQLIGNDVRMVDTLRDIVYTPELVKKKWGVPPEQFVDWQAMVGDKSDNIPGVPGIGAKGAAQLLERFGDLETILASTAALKGRQKTMLEENADDARLSQALATLDRNAPIATSLDELAINSPDEGELNSLYRDLEFFSLLESEDIPSNEPNDDEHDYALVSTKADVSALMKELRGSIAAVVPLFETDSPVQSPLVALAFSVGEGHARILPLEGIDGLDIESLTEMIQWLSEPKAEKVSFNAKELFLALYERGITLSGISSDPMLESFLVDPTKIIPHRLDQVAKEYLHYSLPSAKEVVGAGKKQKRWGELSPSDYLMWLGQRVDTTFRVWPLVRRRLEEEEQTAYFNDIELPLSWLLARMESAGILVDPDSLHTMGDEFGERLAEYEAKIYELGGSEFNIASTKQLSKVLFEDLGLPVIKRTKTGYSTNAEVLERLVPSHPIAAVLLEHRKLAKLINTYTEVLQHEVKPESGRIHATFQQTVGATGRLITTEPDLQRTPIKTKEGKRIRETFVAPLGCKLLSADWSQIELRLLAHMTGDELLVESFREGLDVHSRTAAQLFDKSVTEVSKKERGIGKLVNFSTIYGQGATALGKILDVPRKEAQGYIEGYFRAYSGVREWLDRTMAEAGKCGYVTTLMGRRRYISELSSNSFMIRQAGERIAANTPIQGSAADLCKLAMLQIDEAIKEAKLKSRMLLQVHDELIFECPTAEVEVMKELVKNKMESAFELRVPLVVDVGVGNSWAEAH